MERAIDLPPGTLPSCVSMLVSNRHRCRMRSEPLFKMHKLLRKLSTPEKIQRYLDDLPYNKERAGETCRSPRLAIEFNTAHCFEGALLAAAALRVNGQAPLILDLASVRD